MAEKDKIATEKVKQDGIFDFKDVYRFLYTYATDLEYEIEESLNSVSGYGLSVRYQGFFQIFQKRCRDTWLSFWNVPPGIRRRSAGLTGWHHEDPCLP